MARPPLKAQELADDLAAQVRSGVLPAGSWLPSERQLAETYGLGRSTVRQATQFLAEDGLIELVAGSGARVRATPAEHPDDVRGEVQALRRRVAELEVRLAAVEAHFGPSVPEV